MGDLYVCDNDGVRTKVPNWRKAVEGVYFDLLLEKYDLTDAETPKLEVWVEDSAGNLLGGPLTVEEMDSQDLVEREAPKVLRHSITINMVDEEEENVA